MKAQEDDTVEAEGGVEEESEGSAVAEGEEDEVEADDENKPLQPSPDADTHILFSKMDSTTGTILSGICVHFNRNLV